MSYRTLILGVALLAFVSACTAATDDTPLLLQQPTLSRTQIVFQYGGYLWSVSRDGGEAHLLTTAGHERAPIFSPDGDWIAFTGEYDGNVDVYVMPSKGGDPRRLTWHPDDDVAVGWTPDSKRVLFRSSRDAFATIDRLYTVPIEGGWPEVLPMWRGEDGWFSPDASRIAYVPNLKWQTAWKRYRGGQTTPIYILRLNDLALEKIPRQNSNDSSPVWFGDTVYFLSDRNGPVTLFAYDTKSKTVRQVIENKGLDLKRVSAGPDALVYEQFGGIYLLEPKTGKSIRIAIQVSSDLPATRPHFEKVADTIRNAGISPTGVRAVFEARGEVLTVPAEKGDARNLTRTTSAAEHDPAWSPDGKWIAFFSDESGEYALHIVDQSGSGPVKKINLGNPPSYFYRPIWSPDSKKIAYSDKRLNFWYVDVEKGRPVKVDTDRYDDSEISLSEAWSPDSQWLTYSKFLRNHFRAVFVYSLNSGSVSQITDGLGDARYPVFDKRGKELFFAASTDLGLTVGSLDLSSFQHPVTRVIYAVVLKRGAPSPMAPESDEEKGSEEKQGGSDRNNSSGANQKADPDDGTAKRGETKEESVKVSIDLEGIDRRIIALPVRPANYVNLQIGKAGVLFLTEIPDVPRFAGESTVTVTRFDVTARKAEPFLGGNNEFGIVISADGEKALYHQGENWFIAKTESAPKPGEGALNVANLNVYVDPRAEWNQMYHEVWRIERDFLYDPGHHGVDLVETEKKYAPYLKGIGGRADLNYLFDEMLGEFTLSHIYIFGGDVPQPNRVAGGLLGTDYKIEKGRYRFARIYNGENWNPELRAPLTQPGANVNTGDYLLEINGTEVRPPADVSRYLENTAGKQVRLKVGPDPDGKDAREVTVVPVADEYLLRNRAWEEDNRRRVDELSGGKIAYVYVPDTNADGYLNFNRHYFAQVGKQAAIIDERYNGGGQIADYIIDELERPLRNCATTREGEDFCSPQAQIYGPKTMIINEMSGSGGDALPWMFRQDKIGLLVGTRTWGGLNGIWHTPRLIDGGAITAPRGAFYGLHGQWEVENQGIAPDVEIENDPASVAAGHDVQLEKAVEITLESLKKNPVVLPNRPPHPNYLKN
jgi:tricorn protease